MLVKDLFLLISGVREFLMMLRDQLFYASIVIKQGILLRNAITYMAFHLILNLLGRKILRILFRDMLSPQMSFLEILLWLMST